MRAKNYNNQTASFMPLEPRQIIRVVLVEGMKPQYPYQERQRSRRLLKQYLGISDERIDRLFSLLEVPNPTERQREFLDDLIAQAAYDSKFWRSFDYSHLKREGIIIEHDGQDVGGLVRLMEGIDENKVVFVPSIGDVNGNNEVDYRKHVPLWNTFFMNGIQAVRAFAARKGIELPEAYKRSFPIRNDVWDLLESKHDPSRRFYFIEALHSTIDALKLDAYFRRVISRMAIKKSDGTDVTWHAHDDVESAEFYIYCLLHNQEPLQTLGDMIMKEEGKPAGDKYFGTNTFRVPKRTPIRTPEGLITHNEVLIHYFPDILGVRYPLDWTNTDARCNEPDSTDRSNYEVRRGKKMARFVPTHDMHTMMISLARMRALGITPEQAVNNMSPIPSLDYSRMVDKFRYNLAYEIPRNGRAPERKYVGEVGIETLIHELWKQPKWTFERMFNPDQKVGRQLLRPMYV